MEDEFIDSGEVGRSEGRFLRVLCALTIIGSIVYLGYCGYRLIYFDSELADVRKFLDSSPRGYENLIKNRSRVEYIFSLSRISSYVGIFGATLTLIAATLLWNRKAFGLKLYIAGEMLMPLFTVYLVVESTGLQVFEKGLRMVAAAEVGLAMIFIIMYMFATKSLK